MYAIKQSTLEGIADAIRIKSGKTQNMSAKMMRAEILALNVSGSDELPVYGGKVNLGASVSLFDFFIDTDPYKAQTGMTWYQWCNSAYNTVGAYSDTIDGNAVISYGDGSGGILYLSDSAVSPDDLIIENSVYTFDFSWDV